MLAPDGLLLTKIKIPRSRPQTVVRPQLNSLIEAGLSRKLTLLSAPPGSGKTTLLTEWQASQTGANFPLAWLSLDENDNDPIRFWRYLITALRTLAKGVGEESLAWLQTPQPPGLESVITALINSILEELDSDFGLVLDDYHVIRLKEIHASLSFLLDHMPSHMHLIIATRTDPLELPLSRLRVRRELLEIRSSQLRFTSEEARALLGKVLDHPLPATELTLVENRTEGWAAGLQLVALSLQNHPDPLSFVRSFNGTQRLVLDYLADEVFYRQSEEIQEFLLGTAILGQLNEGLTAAVSGQLRSREMLEKLDRNNLFLTGIDNSGEWYRFHPLFADFLVDLLKQKQPGKIPELHRRAANWYEANGFEAEALTHSLEAGDFSKAVELLFKLVLPLIHQGQSVTVMGWFKKLPGEVLRQHPRLNTLYASALMVANLFDEMTAPISLAEAAFR